jgi:hypothetical protein
MKNNFLRTIVVPSSLIVMSFLAACGEYQKDPVSDITTLREDAKVNAGPNKARVITERVIVKEQIPVAYAESKVDQNFIVITAESGMTFNEGTSTSFEIRARVLLDGVKIKLVGQGLPNGASLTASPKDPELYVLTWKPDLYTVPNNVSMTKKSIKIVAEVLESSQNKENAAKLKGLFRETSLDLLVLRNQESPSAISVTGITNEVLEGQIVPMTLVVTIPGIDGQTAQKPRMSYTYDGVASTAGNEFLEMDGTRHLTVDMSQTEAKYLGDSKWQFKYLLDTKNISIQPQLAKNGSVMENADGTRVRFSFKAYTPAGMSSPEKLVQVKLKYNSSKFAPKFELLGLGQSALTVSRGENITLKFRVATTEATASTKLVSAGSSLPGQPSATCVDSAKGANTQDCTLTWTVPCDAALDQLNGYIDMKAVSKTETRTSEETGYSLKVTTAKKEKNLCAAAAKAAATTEKAPAAATQGKEK